MAINTDTQAPELTLRNPWAIVAAVGSLILAVGVMVAMLILLFTQDALGVAPQVLAATWFVGMGAVGVMAAYLLVGRRSAAFLLMAVWMIIATAGVLAAFAWLLGGSAPLGFPTAWAIATVLLAIFPPAAIVGLLIAAVPDSTRSRYASMVGVSVVAAVVVVVVLNMVSFRYGFEQDFEQLGRFGLSQRGRDIVRQVEAPMTLSVVYNTTSAPGADEQTRARQEDLADKLDRVNELLSEIHRINPRIEVVDASSDAARSLLMARLRERQQARTGQHQAVLNKLRGQLPELKQAIDVQQAAWRDLPPETYLAEWAFGTTVADTLGQTAGSLRQVERDIRDELNASPLPDYVALLEQLTTAIDTLNEVNQAVAARLETMAKIPSVIEANAAEINGLIAQSVQTIERLKDIHRNARDAATPPPPRETISQLADTMGQGAIRLRKVITALRNMTEDEDVYNHIAATEAWRSDYRLNLTGRLELIARQLDDLRARLAVMLQDANETALEREVQDIGEYVDAIVTMTQDTQAIAQSALEKLQHVDSASQAIFDAAQQGLPLGAVSSLLNERIQPLLDQAAALEAPSGPGLPPELTEENIVIIEAGDDLRVLTFEDLWPPQVSTNNNAENDESTRRFFNGDAAIAAALLDLTHEKPFARVLLTYASTPTPEDMDPRRFRSPEGPIRLQELSVLRKHLQDANFEVAEWNLANPMPQPADDDTDEPADATQPIGPKTPGEEPRAEEEPSVATELPTILLVLPPAPSTPIPGRGIIGGVNDEQFNRLRQAVDNGASAIFLAMFMQPQFNPMGGSISPDYVWNRYLKEDWGIEAEVDKWVIATVPGDKPGLYRLDAKFYFLELTAFDTNNTAELIGGPLRGRRMIWQFACPVRLQDQQPEGVDVQPLLTVPDTHRHIWAVADFQALAGHYEQGRDEFSPQTEEGDLVPPFPLAVTATRNSPGEDDKAPARLMVLGIGGGMVDAVVDSPILYMGDGLRALEPARANPDLVVNGCYWLIGREQYILAGAVSVGPVEPMSPATQNILAAVCLLVLPLSVLIAGGLVNLARRGR
jgi:hypothetical protein